MKPILMNLPMPITTPRLLIRSFQVGDEVVINSAILESIDFFKISGNFND